MSHNDDKIRRAERREKSRRKGKAKKLSPRGSIHHDSYSKRVESEDFETDRAPMRSRNDWRERDGSGFAQFDRFLRSNVGRPWAKVYSDAVAGMSPDARNIFERSLCWKIETDPHRIESELSANVRLSDRFYVDDNGILRYIEKSSRKDRDVYYAAKHWHPVFERKNDQRIIVNTERGRFEVQTPWEKWFGPLTFTGVSWFVKTKMLVVETVKSRWCSGYTYNEYRWGPNIGKFGRPLVWDVDLGLYRFHEHLSPRESAPDRLLTTHHVLVTQRRQLPE